MPWSQALLRIKADVLAVLADIPTGRATTYGAIARHLDATPRQVAYILATLTAEESAALPWYRVVAEKGVISSMKRGSVGRRQIARLREEGISVTPRHKIEDFDMVFWLPGSD